jgi:hypothetical protein
MLIMLAIVAAGALLAGCDAAYGAQPLSDTGYPLNIAVASQPVYLQVTCSGATSDTLAAGASVVDMGTMGTNCEEIVYQSGADDAAVGYLPVYGMRRPAGGVRCRAAAGCVLRAGPGASYAQTGQIGQGEAAKGYGTAKTGAIMTDGQNFDWWEVIDPASGARADIFGPAAQVF